MTITIDAAAQHLLDHTRTFNAEIQTATRLGLEMETMVPYRGSDGEYYVTSRASSTEVLQPYQPQFTPKGSVDHDETSIRVRPIKLDLTFTEEDLEQFYDSWKIEWMNAGKNPLEWTYPRYIYEKELLPQILEEINTNSWSGIYAAPTPGTAGASAASVNGYKKVLADLITASAITPIVIGATTASNARENVEAFLAAIPEKITKKGGKILMSPAQRRFFVTDYRGEFMQAPGVYPQGGGPKKVEVDDYNVELVSVASMAGSGRWIFLPNGRDNMVWVSRKEYPTYPQIIFDTAPRVLQMYATFYRGYGFEYPQEVYVNDQV